jgi:chromate reductase
MQKTPVIAVFVGSLRAASLNRRLALALVRLLGERAECRMVDIGTLPHYSEDEEQAPPASVIAFRRAVQEADAFLFVTPEYNRSVPGVLKNAIDQGSRPKGQSVWKGKPAGILGCSPGALGACMAQQHLRNILAAVDVAVMGQPEAYIQAGPDLLQADGEMRDERVNQFLSAWCDAFLHWHARLVN